MDARRSQLIKEAGVIFERIRTATCIEKEKLHYGLVFSKDANDYFLTARGDMDYCCSKLGSVDEPHHVIYKFLNEYADGLEWSGPKCGGCGAIFCLIKTTRLCYECSEHLKSLEDEKLSIITRVRKLEDIQDLRQVTEFLDSLDKKKRRKISG